MKHMKTMVLSAALAASLSACVVLGSDNQSGQGQAADRVENFSCQNGLSVAVRHLGNDRVELRLDDKRTVMSAAVSGSGERYTSHSGLFGTGAEWHQKGGDAALSFKDPYGNAVNTTCSRRG